MCINISLWSSWGLPKHMIVPLAVNADELMRHGRHRTCRTNTQITEKGERQTFIFFLTEVLKNNEVLKLFFIDEVMATIQDQKKSQHVTKTCLFKVSKTYHCNYVSANVSKISTRIYCLSRKLFLLPSFLASPQKRSKKV